MHGFTVSNICGFDPIEHSTFESAIADARIRLGSNAEYSHDCALPWGVCYRGNQTVYVRTWNKNYDF